MSEPTAEHRLRLAHAARRVKEHQLDDIRRALCDIGFMEDDDPYSHADLADVIRQVGQTLPTEQAEAALARVRALAEQWQAAMRPGETHPAAQQILAALGQAAHDGGPTVQEATADDRAHWTNKHAGEGP